jgi:intracellular septation protein
MSDTARTGPAPLEKAALDFVPLVLFFGVLVWRDNIFLATAVFMGAIALVVGYTLTRHRRVSPMLAVTAVIVLVLGGLTLYLHDKTFIKIKPTIVYCIFAIVLGAGLFTGRNFIKLLLEQSFHLPDAQWRTLTIRWIGFFIFMAILNEIVWRNFSDEVWAGFKLFGAIPLTFLFALAQTPFIFRHQIEDEKKD